MERHHKIRWRKGLEVTPETFIEADNYHIAERSLLGRYSAFRWYGILSGNKFNINFKIDNQTLSIHTLECVAITREGYLINIQGDTPYANQLNLDMNGTDFYVLLTVDPYSFVPVDDKGLYVCPEYNLVLKRTEEAFENGIPVLKLYKEYQSFKMDEQYIPPSIALDSVPVLTQRYLVIRDTLNAIIEKLPRGEIYISAMLLKMEINNYSLQESPQELVLLMKKTCRIFQFYLKTAKRIDELTSVDDFINEVYNHNDTEKSLKMGLACLHDIHQKIDEKPREIPMEDIIEV